MLACSARSSHRLTSGFLYAESRTVVIVIDNTTAPDLQPTGTNSSYMCTTCSRPELTYLIRSIWAGADAAEISKDLVDLANDR